MSWHSLFPCLSLYSLSRKTFRKSLLSCTYNYVLICIIHKINYVLILNVVNYSWYNIVGWITRVYTPAMACSQVPVQIS